MAGIKHLFDLSDKGKEFLDDLLSQKLEISEKVDSSAISIMKKGGKLNFYNRNERKALTKLDRTVISLYEPFIKHMQSIPLKNFKEGEMYSMELFQNTNPVEIQYDYTPKNGLMLTNIKQVKNGKVTKVITDPIYLNKKAKQFKIDGPFIIFQGKLNQDQKDQIYDFVTTDFSDLVKQFETNSFTRFIVSILNPDLKHTALRYGIDNPIEGLVFKFNNGKKEFLAKLVDPAFTAKAKSKALKRKDVSPEHDYRKKVIKDIAKFIDKNISKISSSEIGDENRMLDIMFQLTRDFIDKNKSYVSKIQLQNADSSEFEINTAFINNIEAEQLFKSGKAKKIFQLMLTSFRKKKNRVTANFSKEDIDIINNIVNKINNKIKETPVTQESINFFDYVNHIELIEEMTFKQYVKNQESLIDNVLFLGRMAPPTSAHIKIIKNALKKFNKVFVCIVKGAKSDPKKNPFSLQLQQEILNDIFGNRVVVFTSPIGYIPSIIDYVDEKYDNDINVVIAGTDRVSGYESQLSKKYPDVKVLEIPRSGKAVSATKLREALLNNDYDEFVKNADPKTYKYYNKLKQEIEGLYNV